MAARTPSIHVFLGRPLFLLFPGILVISKYVRRGKKTQIMELVKKIKVKVKFTLEQSMKRQRGE